MPNIGGPELIIILIIALIIVGPGKLPDVGQALGKTIREFRKAASDVRESTSLDTPPATTQSAPPQVSSAAPAAPPATPAASDAVAAPQGAPVASDHQTPVS